MMLVMLAVAWPVTSVCDHHDAIGMRETLARVDHPIFTSRVQPCQDPLQPQSPSGGSIAGQGLRARSLIRGACERVSRARSRPAAPGANPAMPRFPVSSEEHCTMGKFLHLGGHFLKSVHDLIKCVT